MRIILIIVAVLTCTLVQAKDNERPNIIFILADDIGAGDLHCTGHPYALTPNLDQLADRGIRFDRAYMAGSWCAPSRFGLMSGQYPAREFDSTHNLRADQPCVTKLLNDAGYRTAHIGKWHINDKENESVQPSDFGIDYHFLTNCPKSWDAWKNGEKNQEYWRAKSTDYYVDKTIDFINKTGKSQPFYVNLWIYPTHSYIHPTPKQLAVYQGLKVNVNDFSPYQQEFLQFVSEHGDIDKAMQAYCADITAMDKALGRLFSFLEQKGLDKNTLIVFTSDNGPGPLTPQLKTKSVVERYKDRPDLLNSVGSARDYKERKISLHDGGIRTPYIVYWPKHTPKGEVDTESILHGVDWLPTVASICDVKLPEGQLDGRNVKAAFLGTGIQRKEAVYWKQNKNVASLQDNWKGVINEDDKFQLYDILKDPAETNNVQANFPEIAEKLEKELRKWKKEIVKK